MRASGAKNRRTSGQRLDVNVARRQFLNRSVQLLADFPQVFGKQFAANRDDVFPVNLFAGQAVQASQMFFDEAVQFLDNENFFNAVGEFPQQVVRERERESQLQNGRFGPDFFNVLVRDAAGDNAEFAVAVFRPFDTVKRGGGRLFHQLDKALFDVDMQLTRSNRQKTVLHRDFVEMRSARLNAFAFLNQTARVRDAGCRAEHNRRSVLFRQFHAVKNAVFTFLRVRRLQNRDLGESGVMARVLLVLGRVHAGVVCNDADKSAFRAHVGKRHKRVSGDVQSNQLLRADRSDVSQRRADRAFKSNLFVGRPFAVDVVLIFNDVLENFRRWRARVSGRNFNARFVRAASDGFVTAVKFFHDLYRICN